MISGENSSTTLSTTRHPTTIWAYGTGLVVISRDKTLFLRPSTNLWAVLEFFKKNHVFNSLLLLPYALVIRSVVILFPEARIKGEILGSWGGDFITFSHTWGAGEFFLSTFLVFIQAAIINRLFIKQSMIGEINLFPGLCYVLLTSLHPSFIGISSLLLANTTMLIAFGYLFDVLKKDRQEETRFMAGWWLSVSGLLYSPYFTLILFGLLAMSMLKTLKVKDIFQFVTGYISPFLIGWMIRVIITGDINPVILEMFNSFGLPELGVMYNLADIVTLSVMALLLLISLLAYSQIIARKNIHAQKKIDTMYALVFFTLLMAFFVPVISIQYLMVLIVPFSLFMAILLRGIRHPAIAESLHFILFVLAIITQFLFLV